MKFDDDQKEELDAELFPDQEYLELVCQKIDQKLAFFKPNNRTIKIGIIREACLELFECEKFTLDQVDQIMDQIAKIYPLLTTIGMACFLENLANNKASILDIEEFTDLLAETMSLLPENSKIPSINRMLAMMGGDFRKGKKVLKMVMKVGLELVEDLMGFADLFEEDENLVNELEIVLNTRDKIGLQIAMNALKEGYHGNYHRTNFAVN